MSIPFLERLLPLRFGKSPDLSVIMYRLRSVPVMPPAQIYLQAVFFRQRALVLGEENMMFLAVSVYPEIIFNHYAKEACSVFFPMQDARRMRAAALFCRTGLREHQTAHTSSPIIRSIPDNSFISSSCFSSVLHPALSLATLFSQRIPFCAL